MVERNYTVQTLVQMLSDFTRNPVWVWYMEQTKDTYNIVVLLLQILSRIKELSSNDCFRKTVKNVQVE